MTYYPKPGDDLNGWKWIKRAALAGAQEQGR